MNLRKIPRARGGLLPVNSFWISGTGALPAGLAPGQPLPMAFDPQHAWLFAA